MEEQLPVYLAWEPAHQPDVLLAEQKDSGIIDRYVLSHLQEFIPSQLMRHNKDLAIVTGRLLYYAMCALNGRTVGEEYANIFSVTKNQPQNLFKIVASRTVSLFLCWLPDGSSISSNNIVAKVGRSLFAYNRTLLHSQLSCHFEIRDLEAFYSSIGQY